MKRSILSITRSIAAMAGMVSGSAGLYADEGTRHSAAVNKFSIPSFVLGIVIGFSAGFGVFGGACRPSPTPTDDGKPIPVSAPAEIPKAADVPIAAPVVVPEVKVEVPVSEVPSKPAEIVVTSPKV